VEARDLLVTPVLIIIVYAVAFVLRPFFTDPITRRYFFPALTVKIVGAIALGFIYQFYYGGGDTFNYHTHGSRHIWEAFMESPSKGFQLLFNDGESYMNVYRYASKILFFKDPQSYTLVKIAAVLDLFTFSTYSATAVLFSIISFIGMWMLFLTFYQQYPHLHKWIAIACFFVPSVFFWGSGLLKDTVTLGCLGIATYGTYKIFIQRKLAIGIGILWLIALYLIYSIKIYILLTFLPAAILWVFVANLSTVKSTTVKVITLPFVLTAAVALGYYAMLKAGEDNKKYALDSLAKTAQVTAYDILYYTGRDAGSGYSLGELDGTFGSMVKLAPQAVNVSLFRPYVWEVRNPLMLLSALESAFMLGLCLYIIYKKRLSVFSAFTNPNTLFCFVFAISFAFAVGVSTFNFGTLVRYKIPLIPFFLMSLILMLNHSNSPRNVAELDKTE
jgi:hypothetical protein